MLKLFNLALLHFLYGTLIYFSALYIVQFLIRCGDIERNPGPNEINKVLNICHWNLNGITSSQFIR